MRNTDAHVRDPYASLHGLLVKSTKTVHDAIDQARVGEAPPANAATMAVQLMMTSTDETTRAIRHAITSSAPLIRYQVGLLMKTMAFMHAILPDAMMDGVIWSLAKGI